MNYRIDEIEGIGPAHMRTLYHAGITSTTSLLEKCGTVTGRKVVSVETGLSEKVLLNWANMADLMRLSGVGRQFAELLEAAGVDTVKELAQRNARNLAETLKEVNAEKKLSKTAPSLSLVTGWIEQAAKTKPMIHH